MPRSTKVLSDHEIAADDAIMPEIMEIAGLKDLKIRLDPNILSVPASDQNGNTAKANFNLPPQMVKAASVLVYSRKYPQFQTPSDFYRFAIFLAENVLMANEEEFVGIIGQLNIMHQMSVEQEETLVWADTIRLAESVIQKHLMDGEDGRRRAVKYVSNLYAIVEGMMKGDPGVGKMYKRRIDERFGHVMRNAAGMRKKGEGMAARSVKRGEDDEDGE